MQGSRGLIGPWAVAVVVAVGLAPGLASAQNCQPVPLGVPGAAQGSLAPGDCTLGDLGLDPGPILVDVYSMTVPPGGFLTVDLQSGAFDTFVEIFDETISELVSFDDDGGAGTNSRITSVPIPPGSYRVLASSFFEGETGAYSISTSFEPMGNPACDVRVPLPSSAIAAGSLAPGDCTLAQLGFDLADQSFVDFYTVSLPTGGPITIGLESKEFDPYLLVTDDAITTVVAEDDDGGADLNSLITDLAVAPGSYVVMANAFSAGETGSYTLTLMPEPSRALMLTAALCALGALCTAGRRSAI